jgi:ATP-dependent protease ClpP protease subunit
MPTSEEETEVEECVKVIGNEILFYADVDRENALDFVEKFKKLEIDLLKKKAELVGYEPTIRIHIMSEGGDIFAGLTMMNTIETSRVKVITIAQGSCCSAATFMLLGGAERRMGRNSYILIHQLSTEMWGNFQELKHELKSTDKFMRMLKKMYLEKTEIPEKKFKRLMRKDIYLSPSDCLKYKIVDAVE